MRWQLGRQLHVGAEGLLQLISGSVKPWGSLIQVLRVQVIEDLHLPRPGGKTHLPAAGILAGLLVGHLSIVIMG